MSLLDSLPHRVTLARPSYTNDAYGASLESLVNLATSVAAWLFNASANEVAEFERAEERVTFKVVFSSNRNLRPGDRITVTSSGAFNGKELVVKSYSERSAGLNLVYVAYCDEDTNQAPESWT